MRRFGFRGGGPSPPLDAYTAGLTGAWSMSRKLLTSYGGSLYTDVSGAVSALLDQSGNSRNLAQGTASARPAIITAGNQSRAAADFDGTNDFLAGATMANFIAAANGYIVASGIINSIGTNSGTVTSNDPLWGDDDSYMGLYMRSNGTWYASNYDGSEDVASITNNTGTGSAKVVRWMHTGGNVSGRVNLGTAASAASGDTTSDPDNLRVGGVGPFFSDMTLFEMACWSTVPSDTAKNAIEQAFLDWIS